MATIDSLQERYQEFVAKRDWEQFHTPKNLSEAISIESGELLETFLWHDNYDADSISEDPDLTQKVEEELADIVIYSLALSSQLEIDLIDAVEEKMEQNEERFDMETSEEMTENLKNWKRS
ncbi:nucleotide pyrophosphohydrolase [Halorubrum distributum]|uniref:MazG nucleotide pyrophosphohydrolase n=1 Tax=Halorubrum distributum JCM 10247 TaxID=1227486 RepID=M0D9R1_9EURY|nr:nucleotide pyrophosphohydrolase [Halorubrum terrestre]ELZ31533.1 hypothetical protein C473_11144 [Halorubrum terrestre JCM 10247]